MPSVLFSNPSLIGCDLCSIPHSFASSWVMFTINVRTGTCTDFVFHLVGNFASEQSHAYLKTIFCLFACVLSMQLHQQSSAASI